VYSCGGGHCHHRRTRRRTTPITTQQVPDSASTGTRQYQAELFGVRLRAQARVDAATAQQQDLLERRSELAVEPRVDERVEKTVGIPEPEEQSAQPVRDAFIVAERFYERQYEERQPVEDTSVHVVIANQ